MVTLIGMLDVDITPSYAVQVRVLVGIRASPSPSPPHYEISYHEYVQVLLERNMLILSAL